MLNGLELRSLSSAFIVFLLFLYCIFLHCQAPPSIFCRALYKFCSIDWLIETNALPVALSHCINFSEGISAAVEWWSFNESNLGQKNLRSLRRRHRETHLRYQPVVRSAATLRRWARSTRGNPGTRRDGVVDCRAVRSDVAAPVRRWTDRRRAGLSERSASRAARRRWFFRRRRAPVGARSTAPPTPSARRCRRSTRRRCRPALARRCRHRTCSSRDRKPTQSTGSRRRHRRRRRTPARRSVSFSPESMRHDSNYAYTGWPKKVSYYQIIKISY